MTIEEELELVCNQNGGVLRAEDVVEFARDSGTALHSKFTWDDGQAAHLYRLQQARNVINVMVRMVENVSAPVPIYVSLVEERRSPGGGYRRTEDVMRDPEQRLLILKQAQKELESWQRRYAAFDEFGRVFREIERIIDKKRRVKTPERSLITAIPSVPQ